MSTTQSISIHRALTELKTLTERIEKAIHEADYMATDRKSAKKIEGLTIEEYEKTIQSGFDKAVSLIERRIQIKDAIVQSNAMTEVVVAGETMTVAKAIERKTSIQHEEELLDAMIEARRKAVNKLTKENAKKEEVELHTKAFMERNEYILIDPLHLNKRVEELEEKISSFKADVDAALSESNALTKITV